MEPVDLKYASRQFMLTKLDRMGYTGDAAALSKRIHLPIDEQNTASGKRAAASHQLKYEMDQAANAEARDSVGCRRSAVVVIVHCASSTLTSIDGSEMATKKNRGWRRIGERRGRRA